jgi:hypothetical protein
MPVILTALISGTLFGIGLAVSHKINPAKVLGSLDIFDSWDPSLALVMAGSRLFVTGPGVLAGAGVCRRHGVRVGSLPVRPASVGPICCVKPSRGATVQTAVPKPSFPAASSRMPAMRSRKGRAKSLSLAFPTPWTSANSASLRGLRRAMSIKVRSGKIT